MSAVHISEVPFQVLKLFQLWTILLTLCPIMSGHTWTTNNVKIYNLDTKTPIFDNLLINQLDVTAGQTILLPCTVKYLGDKVVSWIRSKDLHILTSGPHTFSSDNRFEAVYSPKEDFWGLRIRGVHISDMGQYECQVNTDPKMSLAINLTVTTVSGVRKWEKSDSKWVWQALIKGPNEVYVRDGSPVALICEISPLLQAHDIFISKPQLLWLHNNKQIPSTANEGISIDTLYREVDLRVFSKLSISKVTWKDSGQYTCSQSHSTKSDSIKLIISEGEHSEAMQRDSPFSSKSGVQSHVKFIFIALFIMYFYV